VFEKYVLQDQQMPALQTFGMEGFWGICFGGALLVVFTYARGDAHGSIEDFADTLSMWENSEFLLLSSLMFVFSVGMHGICYVGVIQRWSNMTNVILESCQTATVWLVALALYYAGYESWGAKWDQHAWLQLLGFVLLVLGNLIYNSLIRVPGFSYEEFGSALSPRMPRLLPLRFGMLPDTSPACSCGNDASAAYYELPAASQDRRMMQ